MQSFFFEKEGKEGINDGGRLFNAEFANMFSQAVRDYHVENHFAMN